ncbi:hypothetical protein RB213_001154 [Colletotrichum asianum]|uniref:Transmembrane protein n=1 Tax=Colletotrichum asianum TaxID=702518 RepID=A0A8H3VZK5_9PEZI|nr:hypothetical protein GQ607_015646 [Colletotrichum asianum]
MSGRCSRSQSYSAASGREETPLLMFGEGSRSRSFSALSRCDEYPRAVPGDGSRSRSPSASSRREESPPTISGKASRSPSPSASSGRKESSPAVRTRGSRSPSSSASSKREESPPNHHAIRFTISLPRIVEKGADETSERRGQDGEEGKGRVRRRHERRGHDDQDLILCFHSDWIPTVGTLELHFSSGGIQTSLEDPQPRPHEEDARVLTLECNRITFPISSSSPFRLWCRSLCLWVLVGVGLYIAARVVVMISVETHIYLDRSALRSMEQRWREIPLSAELGRVALLYGDAASSLVELAKSAESLLSNLGGNIVPLCRHADILTHSIKAVCDEYDAVLNDAVGTHAALKIQASSWNVAGAINGSRVEGLLSCWNGIDREYIDDDDVNDDNGDGHATGAVFSCVAELLRRWDTDSTGLLSPAAEEAGRLEGQLREMGARQDWIVDPFEELLRQEDLRSASSSSATARAGMRKVAVPPIVAARVSAMRNETDAEFARLMGRIVQWQEAMVAAGAERALLEARLSIPARKEWVTWHWGRAVLWKFPAMDRMVSDLEGTIKALQRGKASGNRSEREA